MILKRLFRSRKQTSANTQEQQLQDPAARRQSCKQSTDLSWIHKLAEDDPDAGVREFADARLRKLISGLDPSAPNLEHRLSWLQQSADAELCTHVCRYAVEPELRRLAMQQCDNPQVLSACALGDAVAAIRLLAVERLQDKRELEQVAQKLGKKDKKALRLAKEKLKRINQAEQAPRLQRSQAADLCERTERLGRSGLWAQDKAVAEHLHTQWKALDHSLLGDGLKTRFNQALLNFDQAHETHLEAERQRLAESQRHQELKQLNERLQQSVEQLADDDKLPTTLEELLQTWEQASQPLPHEARALDRELRQKIQQKRQTADQEAGLRQHLDTGQSLLQKGKAIDSKQLARWQEQANSLRRTQAVHPLAEQLRHLSEKLDERLAAQQKSARNKLKHLPERLSLLEEELDGGELRKASSLHQSLQADFHHFVQAGIPGQEYLIQEQTLKQLTPRLRDMQKWRKWSTDQHRQSLCEAMEGLRDGDLPLDELHQQLQAMQTEWKQLDHAGSPINEGMWQRFHQAADQVYERCRPYLQAQAEVRQANLRERQALCEKMEEFLRQADWSNMDWKRAVRAEREIREAWSAIGPVEPKKRKALDRRYHRAMKQLDAQLGEERARNKALKTSLIEQAQELTHEDNLDTALQGIKKLQQQWKTSVSCRRKQENQLWRNFRQACDQVYAKRDERQNSLRSRQSENAAALEALCEQLESSDGDAGQLQQRLHKLQTQWRQQRGVDLNRQDQTRLDKRWHKAVELLEQKRQRYESQKRLEQLQRLKTLAQRCESLEIGLQRGLPSGAELDDFDKEIEAMPLPDKGEWRQGFAARRQSAVEAGRSETARQAWLSALEENTQRRKRICLQLEVATGVNSPEEANEERLAYQVNRLSEHLAKGESQTGNNILQLQAKWYLSPAPAANRQKALQERFERALQARDSARESR